VMRAVTLKAVGDGVAQLIGYYAGLARDRLRRDGVARGPVDYYLDPAEPPGRWGARACRPWAWTAKSCPSSCSRCGRAVIRPPGPRWGAGLGPVGPGVRRHVLGGQVGVRAVGAQRRPLGARRGGRGA
jgi:hypothetical protein